MMPLEKIMLTLFLCLHLLMPLAAQAQTVLKTPLSYSLQEYGIVLATALLGGAANWWIKVRRGEMIGWSIAALIGELCVSAFAGLTAFWLCEWWGLPPLLTAAVVGMAGHAGARGLNWMEHMGQRMVESRLGLDKTKDAP
jgi:CHASE2 domain-containing sensor protein